MNKKFSVLINKKIEKFNKIIKVPSDKSCSIRALIFASICIGKSEIKNLLESEDVLSCLKILKHKFNVKIIKKKNVYLVYGNGLNSFRLKKLTKIFVGNSATTARLIMGAVSTYPSKFYFYGDRSMNKRNLSQMISIFKKIGCFFYPKNKSTLPLLMEGTSMPLAQKHENRGSAQIKSAILLSALSTPGATTIEEKETSRNHTENLLKKISADIKIKKIGKENLITLSGQKNLHGFNYTVSADPSSAAFLIVLTLLTPGAKLTIHNVLCNDTRIFFIKILKKSNANIKIKKLKTVSGELVGSIEVSSNNKLKPIIISKDVGKFIDELPILFTLAAKIPGISKFRNVGALKNKESDRLLESKKLLVQAGVKCITTKDSMIIYGKEKIESQNKSILIKTKGDHRICMSSVIFSLATGIRTKINNFETVNTSFPGFIPLIRNLGGKIVVK